MPPNDPLQYIMDAIALVESGGRYDARGPVVQSGRYKGERALGKYQIMPGNLPEWSRAALGREVKPDEFLASPELQDQIARHRLGLIYQRYGNPADTASVWHSGRPLTQAGNARDVNVSTREYVQRVQRNIPTVVTAQSAGDMARLEKALRAADAAGDTTAAQQIAGEIIRLRQAGGSSPGTARVRSSSDAPRAPSLAEAAGGFAAPMTGSAPARPRTPLEEDTLRQEAGVAPASVAPAPQGSRAVAALQGFGSGVFGAGTPVTAALLQAQALLPGGEAPLDAGEAHRRARDIREQARKENPREFYSGMGAGVAATIAGGAGVMQGVRQAAPRVANVFSLQSGQTMQNLARLSATGAAASGVTALNEQGSAPVAAVHAAGGAALGPAVGLAAGAASRAPGIVRGLINKDHAAIRLLAQRTGVAADDLAEAWNRFQATVGRPPSLTEISEEASSLLSNVGRVKEGAGRVARTAATDRVRGLPGELAPIVQGGGATGSVSGVLAQRGAEMDAVMGQIGKHIVPITPAMEKFFRRREVQNALRPTEVGQILSRALGPKGNKTLTVTEWDIMRRALGRMAKDPTAGARYGKLRDRITSYVGRAVPQYSAALRRFERLSNRAKGVQAGSKVLTAETRAFEDGLRAAGGIDVSGAAAKPRVNAAVREGAELGARTKLTSTAGESTQGAVKTVRSLADNPGLQQRVQTALGAPEAQRLTEVGRVMRDAVDNVALSVPEGTPTSARLAQEMQAVQDVFAGAGIASGRASVALQANWGRRMYEYLRLRSSTAEAFARRVTDPTKSAEVIEEILKHRSAEEVRGAMTRAAAEILTVASGIQLGRE